VAHDNATEARTWSGAWEAIIDEVVGFEALYWIILRAGRLARFIAEFAAEKEPMTTEAERFVTERVGQDIFRQSLIDFWQGRCAVTGLDVLGLLRASHIKPWARCETDAERLDVFNGLLLAPHLDALFDGGWISFSDEGGLLVSDELSIEQREVLGLVPSWQLREISDVHRGYLRWHRAELFRNRDGGL
jgi:predicted restriction endonuclease